jgi:DeoR family transcriptional regulator, fructose operon transcriptional repressor
MSAAPIASSPHDRLRLIEARLSADGRVSIAALASGLAVSEMTIRRDLDELEALGVARRVRGGAVAIGPEPFAQRHRHNAKAKARMAEKLLGMLPLAGTVAFDASTTVHRLATSIRAARDLTVVTNGLDAFQALSRVPGVNPTLTGGTREPRTGSLVGPVAVRTAEEFLFDVFVCSAAALDPDVGSSEASLAEAEVKRSFARTSARVVLAVDHTKLGTRAHSRMFRLAQLDSLVTDLSPTDERLDPYRGAVKLV